ncbi:hypothetical protein [Marinicrinis lubricantis]|uniref:Uncharacterized protein n=1 Tax=Marinicrinis lubricantis TaxID=2086470 RepID=A0ABW1IQP1_9BACL
MYYNGQTLTQDVHFQDHIEHGVPVQIYNHEMHYDIGFIEHYDEHYIVVNNTPYARECYRFVSRPGY